jgi:hypothetical protein
MQRLKDFYSCHAAQEPRAGKSGRPRTDDGNPVPVAYRSPGFLRYIFAVPVCNEALQISDRHRLPFSAADALCFTLCFLWTNAAANGGETGILAHKFKSFFEFSFGNFGNEFRNMYFKPDSR